ncbi:MAG: thioredoxin [Lachnospiraceae bacterium]|nr:thioredoxin [Lachnospiraceae bacterium]
MAEINVTTESFEQDVLKSDIPVLVDFWATWCGPCRMLSPILEEIAEEYEGKVTVAKVNVDEEPALADGFRIRNIPTVLLFKNGEVAATSVGYVPKAEIEALLQ